MLQISHSSNTQLEHWTRLRSSLWRSLLLCEVSDQLKQLVTLDCFCSGVASPASNPFSLSSSLCISISLFLWNSDFMTFSATNNLSLRSSFVKSLRLLLRSYFVLARKNMSNKCRLEFGDSLYYLTEIQKPVREFGQEQTTFDEICLFLFHLIEK